MSSNIKCTKSNHRFSFALDDAKFFDSSEPDELKMKLLTWKKTRFISIVVSLSGASLSKRRNIIYRLNDPNRFSMLDAHCFNEWKNGINFFHGIWKIEEGKKWTNHRRGYDKNMNKMSMRNPNGIYTKYMDNSVSLSVSLRAAHTVVVILNREFLVWKGTIVRFQFR